MHLGHCVLGMGLWDTRVDITHTTACGTGEQRALLSSCPVVSEQHGAISRVGERPQAASAPYGGRQEGAGSTQHPVQGSGCVLRHPCQAQLQALVQVGGAITHVVLSPAQSRNSQLELACTRLVQWYLSLLALSDLITRKKLNLTSCWCPEGTLKNSCFSQRLLILHVRRFHSRLAINQVFAWKRLCVPDSPVSLLFIPQVILQPCPSLCAAGWCGRWQWCMRGQWLRRQCGLLRFATPSKALASYWSQPASSSQYFMTAVKCPNSHRCN